MSVKWSDNQVSACLCVVVSFSLTHVSPLPPSSPFYFLHYLLPFYPLPFPKTSTLRLISGKCFYNGTLIYTVLPEDSLMANQIVVRSEDCSKNICLISFMMPTFTRVMNIEFGFFATDGMKLRTMEAVNVTIAASIGRLRCFG